MENTICKVKFDGFGVKREKNNLYISCAFLDTKNTGVKLYSSIDKTGETVIKFDESMFTGNVVSVLLTGDYSKVNYYSFYENDKPFLDRYAKAYSEDFSLGKILNNVKENRVKPEFERKQYSDTYIYQLNVSGQTMLDKKVKKNNGTFEALKKRISHIKDLNVTALELMPVYDVSPAKPEDYRIKQDTKKANFWGFGNGLHFSIKRSLCVSDNTNQEFYDFVSFLHKENLECIPIIQFKDYESIQYILDVLKYYLLEFDVDGFRLIGNGINFSEIISNPLFSRIKLIYDNFDFAHFNPGPLFKYKNLAFQNDTFMNAARKFAKGDEEQVEGISYMIRENARFYGVLRYVTDFHGFTLNDLVSYNVKHNLDNGEENTDGTEYNYSWNCGVEGDTQKKTVKMLRRKMVRNLTMLSVLSQGVPVLRAGDELLNTQFGNNNPYCQDNEIGWIKYRSDKEAKDFYAFLKNLIAFRKRHSVLHQTKPVLLTDYMSVKLPDVSFHGKEAFRMDQSPVSHSFGILYCGDYAKQYTGKCEESVYIVYNMYWEKTEFSLPINQKGKSWYVLYSTAETTDESFDESKATLINDSFYEAKPRSISILLCK